MHDVLRTAIAAGTLLGLMSTAQAHGIWVAERHGDFAIVYGHGSSDEAYDPEKLKSLAGKTSEGEAVEFAIRRQDDHVLFDAPEETAVVIATLDNGYWSEGPDGDWVNAPKTEVDGAKQGGRYLKHSVAFLDHVHGDITPQGLELEIVPLADPTELSAGDTLEVQVLFKGEPAADVNIVSEYTTASDDDRVVTGRDGKATITVRNQGLNVVAASIDEDLVDDPKADKVGHFATLSFNLAYHSE